MNDAEAVIKSLDSIAAAVRETFLALIALEARKAQ
jgi:hypothetical protein